MNKIKCQEFKQRDTFSASLYHDSDCDYFLTRLASLAPGAGVAVLAGADLGADALAAVHAVREADGALAVVAPVAALATTC